MLMLIIQQHLDLPVIAIIMTFQKSSTYVFCQLSEHLMGLVEYLHLVPSVLKVNNFINVITIHKQLFSLTVFQFAILQQKVPWKVLSSNIDRFPIKLDILYERIMGWLKPYQKYFLPTKNKQIAKNDAHVLLLSKLTNVEKRNSTYVFELVNTLQ